MMEPTWEDYGIQTPDFSLAIFEVKPVKVFPNLYRSPRPGYPKKTVSTANLNAGMREFKKHEITDIFCLLTDGEYFKYFGKDLIKQYRNNGFAVHRYPIPDFGVPRVDFAYRIARDLDNTLRVNKRTVVHCSAGMGRTGLAINCLIEWVRFRDKRILQAVNTQTSSQQTFLIQLRHLIEQKHPKGKDK